MKNTITVLLGVGALLAITNVRAGDTASCCADKSAALSPRAQANQTQVVSGSTENLLAARELGTGALAKASGEHSSRTAAAQKDPDLVGRHNSLGFAAKAKSSGTTASGSAIQVAPLK